MIGKPQRRPRFSVADRWGLPSSEPYVAIPVILLRLLAHLDIDPSARLVLIVLVNQWRPENGNTFEMSLSDLQPLTGLSRSRLQEIVRDLCDRPDGALIGYFVGGQGRRGLFDLTPLLATVKRFRAVPATVRPTGHQLSGTAAELSGTPDATVRSTGKTVRWLASQVAAQRPEEQPDARAAASAMACDAPAAAAVKKRTAAEIHAALRPFIDAENRQPPAAEG